MTTDTKQKPSKNGHKKKAALPPASPTIQLRDVLEARPENKTGGIYTIIETTSGTFAGLKTTASLTSEYEFWNRGTDIIKWLMVPGLSSAQADLLLDLLWKESLGQQIDDIPDDILNKPIAPVVLPGPGEYNRTAAQLFAYTDTYRIIMIALEYERLKKEAMTNMERFQVIGSIVGPMILILVLTFVMVISSNGAG